jgi:hypothetical protein
MLNAHTVTALQLSQRIPPYRPEPMYTHITLDSPRCCCGYQAPSLSTFVAQFTGFR